MILDLYGLFLGKQQAVGYRSVAVTGALREDVVAINV